LLPLAGRRQQVLQQPLGALLPPGQRVPLPPALPPLPARVLPGPPQPVPAPQPGQPARG